MSSTAKPGSGLPISLIRLNEELIELEKPVKLLRSLRPVNATEEREKFFAALTDNQDYNPQFEYNPPSFDIKKTREQLSQLQLDSLYSKHGLPIKPLLSFANELDLMLKLIEARATDNFTRWSSESYGVPNEWLIKSAMLLLDQKTSYTPEEGNVSADKVKCQFEQRLYSYGLTHWTILFEDSASARITVSPGEQTITILSGAQFSHKDVERLVAHEIDTHVLRAENGSHQPYYKVLATGLQNYIETEEGLATLNENLTNTLDIETRSNYALRLLAVIWSQQLSFYNTYCKIARYIDPFKAYDLTLRVKRGLHDTSLPGGFTKDYLYFAGQEKLQRYHSEQGDIRILYVGKIGIRDLEYISELIKVGLIDSATYLPSYHMR